MADISFKLNKTNYTIVYYAEPSEPQTFDCPGSPATFEVEEVYINSDTDGDCLLEDLNEVAIEAIAEAAEEAVRDDKIAFMEEAADQQYEDRRLAS